MLFSIPLYTLGLADRLAVKASFNPSATFIPSGKNKYGVDQAKSQALYLEYCTQGVELVVFTIRELRKNELTKEKVKEALNMLLARLAKIRADIAFETESLQADQFGRARKNIVSEVPIYHVTTIDNDQHQAAHQAIKNIMAGYIPGLLHPNNKKGSRHEVIIYDNKVSPNSRYILTMYHQTISYCLKNNPHKIYTIPWVGNEKLISQIKNDPKYKILSSNCDCPKEIQITFDKLENKYPHFQKKAIVVGKIQVKVNDTYITGTTHISWYCQSIEQFNAQSKVILLHMSATHHEKMLDELAHLCFKCITWQEQQDSLKTLQELLPDLQYCFAQSLFYERGSPTISKMLLTGILVEQGFMPSKTTSPVDEYCTAEYFPFLSQFRVKYGKCFDKPPLEKRTHEYIMKPYYVEVNKAVKEVVCNLASHF